MTAVYWLGAPGVSQLEYPPGSGALYSVGQLIPGMTEPEARSMLPLGHNFQIPSVYPYGTPAMEPALGDAMRIPVAARTGEPDATTEGIIVGGAAPQTSWVPPEPEPQAPPPPTPGELVATAADQADWSGQPTTGGAQVVAIAHPYTAAGTVTVSPPAEAPEVVAIAHAEAEPDPEPAPIEEPQPEVVAVAVPQPAPEYTDPGEPGLPETEA